MSEASIDKELQEIRMNIEETRQHNKQSECTSLIIHCVGARQSVLSF